ncbi:MAG: hypothetical protein KKC66_02885 [Candidatus Omnitrophica bacterium]|nr:hypothetical protein [Candidatus Omnitrophota bacterium]MBU1932830.1 hypothetical protein [Candidatus Omnitrophota bacterium]
MKKSLSLTLLVIAGLVLFSIASCGGSKADTAKTDATQLAKADYADDYDYEDMYDAYTEKEPVVSSFKPFPVYSDGMSPDNHYIPSGYMGDYSDIKIDASSFDNPHSGTTCIKIVYSDATSQGARWAGVYWQNPANNWGDRQGGFDLTGATKLTFWARGEKGGERIEEFKVGGLTGLYPDSDIAGIGPVLLTPEWKQYEIDLRGKDLSYISGGFCWASNIDVNPDGMTFYLDDIRYE